MANEDVSLSVGFRGRQEALKFLAQLKSALLGVQGTQGNQQQAQAARQQLAALRDQLSAAQELVRARKEAETSARQDARRTLAEAQASAKASANAARKEIADLQAVANARAAEHAKQVQHGRERVEVSQRHGQQEIKAARQQSAEIVKAARERSQTVIGQAQQELRVNQEALRIRRDQIREERAADKENLANARERVKFLQQASRGEGAGGSVRSALKNAQAEVSAIREANAEREKERRASIAAVQDRIRYSQEVVRQARAQGKAEVDAAKAGGAERVKQAQTTATANTQGTRQRMAEINKINTAERTSNQQAIAGARQRLATVIQAGNAQVASVRQAGIAAIRQAQNAAAGARQQVAGIRQAIAAQVSYIRNLRTMQTATQAVTRSTQGLAAQTQNLARSVRTMVAAYGGFRLISGFVSEGLKFNQTIETATLGIATLITAEAKLEDQTGKVLTGTEALGAASVLAADQMDKLRIAGIQTAATTTQLVDAFQQATAAGTAAGLTLDQIRGFTVNIAQAAGNIGLPFDQLNQEVRSILDATIDRNSRIAKILDIRNEDIRLAKEQNRLAEFLTQKMEAFTIAGEESVKTFISLKSNIKDALSLFAGTATMPLFEDLRDTGLRALREVFDFETAAIEPAFLGLLDAFKEGFGELGRLMSQGIAQVLIGVQMLSQWLEQNEAMIDRIVHSSGDLVANFFGLAVDLAGIVTSIIAWSVESGVFLAVIQSINGVVQLLRDHLAAVAFILGTIATKGLIVAAITNPIAAAVIAGGLLVGMLYDAANAAERLHGEQLRRIDATGQETESAITLTAKYQALVRQMEDTKMSEKELATARAQLERITDDLIRISPDYAEALHQEGMTAEETAAKLRAVTAARIDDMNAQLQQALTYRRILQASKAQFEAETAPREGENEFEFRIRKNRQLDEVTEELRRAEATVNALLDAGIEVADAFAEAQRILATVSVTPHATSRSGDKKRGPKDKSLDDEVQRLTGLLNAAKAATKRFTEEAGSDYARLGLSMGQYYEKLRQYQFNELEVEEKLRQARIRLARARGDQGEIDKAIAEEKIIAERRLEIEAEYQRGLIAAERDTTERRQRLRAEALMLPGASFDSRIMAQAQELSAKYFEDLQVAFAELDWARLVDLAAILESGMNQIRFRELENEISRVNDQLDSKLREVDYLVERRLISEEEGQRRAAAAYAATADAVREYYVQLLALKPLMQDDPEFTRYLEEVRQSMIELTGEAGRASTEFEKLKMESLDAAENGLANFFTDLADGARSVGEVFSSFVRGLIADLHRLVAQLLAAKIVQGIAGLFAGPSIPNMLTIGSGTGGGLAAGGYVRGPGTPTSDSIPMMLSDKEFVQSARAVQHYGVDFNEALNQRLISRDDVRALMVGVGRPQAVSRLSSRNRAMGGAVSAIHARGVGGGSRGETTLKGLVEIGLEEGLIAREVRSVMDSSEGERIHLRLDARTRTRRAAQARGNR
jgi:hypothetical protein